MLDFSKCTTPLILKFHSTISELLVKEDSLSLDAEKEYGIREYNDWKSCADEFERILSSRKVPYKPIKW